MEADLCDYFANTNATFLTALNRKLITQYDLLYLAMAAVIACSILIAFKWSLYTTIRDKSILLDGK